MEGTPTKCPNSNTIDSHNLQLLDQNDLFPIFAYMPDKEFHRLMSVHDAISSVLFSDEVF